MFSQITYGLFEVPSPAFIRVPGASEIEGRTPTVPWTAKDPKDKPTPNSVAVVVKL